MMDKNSKILITGATGFIGTTLVRQLLADGYRLRCMSRSNPVFPPGFEGDPKDLWENPNCEHFQGDASDPDSIRKAVKGCRYIFHLAGYAKNYSKDPSIYKHINIDAMRNVFQTGKEEAVERIVWTSTIVTLGPTMPGEIGNEDTPRKTDKYFTEYEETKSIAEKEAFQWIKNGLPLVIVNPTRVYGPGQLSEGNALGRLIDDYDRGKMPFLPNRGINIGNYVLVDDVAKGHYLAMEKGRIGERYILGGENASLKEFFQIISKITGKKHFQIPMLVPGPLIFSYMQLYAAKIFGIYPRITPGWIRTFVADWTYSCDKAKKELGYSPASLEEGLAKTIDWLYKMRKAV
ncbi:MAG: SDR family oxidoreductase [Planctomycetia bacterium]|nr:SDR family oxidoreductase [Planctomycetia bacterium]